MLGELPAVTSQMAAQLQAVDRNLGLLPEQVDVKTGDMRGNLPQALSNLALIHAAAATGGREAEDQGH